MYKKSKNSEKQSQCRYLTRADAESARSLVNGFEKMILLNVTADVDIRNRAITRFDTCWAVKR